MIEQVKIQIMKKLKLIAFMALGLSVFSSCVRLSPWDEPKPGNQTEEVFNVDDFKTIDLGSAFNVVVVPGNTFKVTASGDERDVEDLNVRVINNKLKVNYLTRKFLGSLRRYRMDILIETPTLEGMDISGAATVDVEDFDGFDAFEIDLSGASKLNFKADVNDLKADISGASNLTLDRYVPFIDADIYGASKLNAYDADSKEVYLKLSGASRANLSVSEYLKVDASGASTVSYKGSPRIDQEVSGASKVTKN
jgi:hypothetical protein